MPAAPALLTAAILSVTPGWDFSLPAEVKPLPDSGLLSMNEKTTRPEILHEGATLVWAQMNPAPGVYDFSRPLKLLNDAQARGKKILLRMRTFQAYEKAPWGEEKTNVPQWILDKYHPPIADMAAEEDDAYPGCVIRIAVPWDPGVRAEHLKFIAALGKSGIPGHPALLGWYVHGISTSLGEEFWFTRKAFDNLRVAGMTATLLEECFTERILAWGRAFGPNAGKLAWVGSGWIDAPDGEWEAYSKMGERIDHIALDGGLGWRGGGIETYNQLFERQGQSLDKDGHFVTDWNHPLISPKTDIQHQIWNAPRRYFGDENEICDVSKPWAAHMYRSAILRALSLGMKTLWTSDEAVALDPAVSNFFNLEAGKTGADAPDAWCWLRETECRHGIVHFKVRDFSRGLHLLDWPSCVTDPAIPFRRAPQWTDFGEPIDWTARTTMLLRSNGVACMAFEIADDFARSHAHKRMKLMVTWLDTGCSWSLSYSTGQIISSGTDAISIGAVMSPRVKAINDERIKTTTFDLPQFPAGGMFQLYGQDQDGKAKDFTVLFVRVMG